MRRLILPQLSAMLLVACVGLPRTAPSDGLDAVARDYVALTLEIGEREPGYVDAYYGPPEWQAAAHAHPRTVEALKAVAAALTRRLDAVDPARLDADSRQRRAFLLAHVSAAAFRLRMIGGERLSFADEAEALFGIRPALQPLATFDPVLAEVDRLLPGAGPLAPRVEAFRARYRVSPDRLRAVMDTAIAECRRRTAARLALPADEAFTLEFVTGKSWSGYNFYQGHGRSLIQINTDLPVTVDRAVDLGCHEGYPGHHVYNALLERTFVEGKGWVEISVYPLYSPMSFIAEGSANYGIDLAFPGEQRTAYEREVLYPMAGLDPASAADLERFLALSRRLARAEYTIADDWLAGRVDRETTIARLQTFNLSTRGKAEQRLRFIDTYRSYIINYGLGRDTVQAWVEGQGPDPWAAMERLLSSQTLPADIAR